MTKEEPIIYLGIDWGEKRIGLAIGDSETKMAVPFGVAKNIEEVIKIFHEEKADEAVLGWPVKLSGNKELVKKEFADFLAELKKNLGADVHIIDERMSSQAADSLFGSKKEKAPRDAIAAMIILNHYFAQSK